MFPLRSDRVRSAYTLSLWKYIGYVVVGSSFELHQVENQSLGTEKIDRPGDQYSEFRTTRS